MKIRLANLLTNREDSVEINMWYLHNRASNYLTGDRVKFKELDEKIIENMKFDDKSILPVEGKGSLLFKFKNNDQCLLNKLY